MGRDLLLGTLAIASFVFVFSPLARAEDITTKKMMIKDNEDTTKRQVQAQSLSSGVQYSEADNPGANGAAIHVYGGTDDFCVQLLAGPEWTDNGTLWKYKNTVTKDQAQIKDGKLKIKIKSGVPDLLDNTPQGIVNVQVQFGPLGVRYCMRCSSPTKDDSKVYLAKDCAVATCDVESPCTPVPTTTTTTTTTTTGPTTTTTAWLPGVELKGVLPKTFGRFNFSGIGVPGANARCGTDFPGTHACTLADLLVAESAGDLNGVKDPVNAPVTHFWAIDATRPDDDQCTVSIAWDYQTVHTGQFGDRVSLNNSTGDLGAVTTGNNCGTMSWVGCCQD